MGKGLLIALSGLSGTGKGTIMKKVMEESPGQYALSVSATTRAPREGERDGVEYFFQTKEEFETLILEDRLIEYAEYVGNYYGTPKDYVYQQMDAGKDIFLEIEVQGALQVKKKFPETVLIFVVPPSIAELRRRLYERGTENEQTIQKRLSRAAQELELAKQYDYILKNENLDRAVAELKEILRAEHDKTMYNRNVLDQLKDELEG